VRAPLRSICAALAALTGPAAASARPEPVAIELLAPADGETLLAGSFAEIAWTVPGTAAATAEPEEWEAFLSFDGGRHWPLRLTPHLDWRVRRFRFRVPDVESDEVRLLLRVGDEREETAVPIAARLRIAISPVAAPAPRWTPARGEPGEAALPGGAGVERWVEGPRDGSRAIEVVAFDAGEIGGADARFDRLAVRERGEAPAPPPSPRAPEARTAPSPPAHDARVERIPSSTRPAGRALRTLLAQQNE